MPVFKIHRQRESAKSGFRFAPHTSGAAVVKQKDYELVGEKEAASAYALFNELRGTADALEVGDVVELPEGALKIYKYVGLEDAAWWVAPVKQESSETSELVEASPAS
jgi:hypothetical protein